MCFNLEKWHIKEYITIITVKGWEAQGRKIVTLVTYTTFHIYNTQWPLHSHNSPTKMNPFIMGPTKQSYSCCLHDGLAPNVKSVDPMLVYNSITKTIQTTLLTKVLYFSADLLSLKTHFQMFWHKVISSSKLNILILLCWHIWMMGNGDSSVAWSIVLVIERSWVQVPGGRIFFSRVYFLCWLLLHIHSMPVSPQ